jgi:hypothetical protein
MHDVSILLITAARRGKARVFGSTIDEWAHTACTSEVAAIVPGTLIRVPQ